MERLTLRYGEDPGTGLPRLEGQGGGLSADALELVRRAVARQFERLASGPDGQLLALDGAAEPDVPRHFRVTVLERGKRCPTLLLEEAAPSEADGVQEETTPETPAAAAGRWQAEFVAAVADWLADAAGDGAARSPLAFVLTDLRAVLRKDPQRLTLLLLAGYLHVGDALSVRHGESGASRYARASEALLQLAGGALPEGSLAPLLRQRGDAANEPVVPPEQPVGWLRRFFSFC